MKTTIKLVSLRYWLIEHITSYIHSLKVKDDWVSKDEFNKWAKTFKREEAAFVVNMEYMVDWGNETRSLIPIEEVEKYAQSLIQKIIDKWYM